jgi:hypothetical protein
MLGITAFLAFGGVGHDSEPSPSVNLILLTIDSDREQESGYLPIMLNIES